MKIKNRNWNRLVLTGAAGHIGKVIRPTLNTWCHCLRLSDMTSIQDLSDTEEYIQCGLDDSDLVNQLLKDVDAVIHLGGVSDEAPYDLILKANIIGVFNLYESARINGVKRIIFASSNHVTGFYGQNEVINSSMPPKPDGHYGISKAYGENLARFYYDRYQIETVCIRIGSAYPQPRNLRDLSTWISFEDLEQLIFKSLSVTKAGFTVVYGVSNNDRIWWDNNPAKHIGYKPKDNAEIWANELYLKETIDLKDSENHFQGGSFVNKGPFF